MSPEVEPRPKSKPTLPKHLQSPLRPSPHRTTSQVSSISVEANQSDLDALPARTLLSQDTRHQRPARERPHSQSHVTRSRAATASSPSSSTNIQRTLSAPGTPGRSTPVSAPSTSSRSPSSYSLSLAPLASGSGSSSPSRKGKEKAVEVDVEVEGELVTAHGDVTKDLRELVRRTTIGEATDAPRHLPSSPTAKRESYLVCPAELR